MSRPLLISDCDEVLLHMVSHFSDWLGEEHDILFDITHGDFVNGLMHRPTGSAVPQDQVWPLLYDFFRKEMSRQTLVPGALEALGRIGEVADIVILTNLTDEAHPWRVEQLASHGIAHQVVCNQGGKGIAVRRLVEERAAGRAAFVDDLPLQHQSVAEHAPEVWRLHMVAEPRLAPQVPHSPHAHARIDDWTAASDWILERLTGGG